MKEIKNWECKPHFSKLWYAEIAILVVMVIFGSIDIMKEYPILDTFSLYEISMVTAAVCRLIFMFWHMNKEKKESQELGDQFALGLNNAFKQIAEEVNQKQINKSIDEYINNNTDTIVMNFNAILALEHRDIRVRVNLLNDKGEYVKYDLIDRTFSGELLPTSTNVLFTLGEPKEGQEFTEEDFLAVYTRLTNSTLAAIFHGESELTDKICKIVTPSMGRLTKKIPSKEFIFDATNLDVKKFLNIEDVTSGVCIDFSILRWMLMNLEHALNSNREDGYKLEITHHLSNRKETNEEDTEE